MNSESVRSAAKSWITLALALTWGGGVVALRQLRPVPEPQGRAEAAALRAELASLPVATERLSVAGEGPSPSDAGVVRVLLESLVHEGWRVTSRTEGPVLTADAPAAMPWAEIIRVLDRLEATPGTKIESARIETTGSRTVRQFSRIEIMVRVRDDSKPTNPARAPAGAGAGPGSETSAAGLREAGSGPLSAVRPPPPAAIPEAGSVFRTGGAPVPATLAPAAGSAPRNLNPNRTW